MMMKIMRNVWMIVALVAFAATGCKNSDAEKKIAELESRLAEIEGKSIPAATPVATTPAAPAEKPDGPLPAIDFETEDFDFGTINEGQVVEHTYTFKNTGEAPLIIQNAQPSCGCTVPDWSKEPIPVGGTGFVKASFDSNGKPNMQNKTITVTTNAWPTTKIIRFKAMVKPKPSADAGPLKQ